MAPVATVLLALALIGTKAAILGRPSGPGYVLDLAAASSSDVALACVLGLAGAAALRASGPRRRACERAILALGAAAVFWACLNVQAYGWFARPLNAQMLGLVGSLADLGSSIGARARPGAIAGLLAPPVLYAAGVVALARRRWDGVPRAALLALAATWIGAGAVALARADPESAAASAAPSPHWVIARSAADRLLGVERAIAPGAFPAAFLEDFRLAEERPRAHAAPGPGPAPPRNVIVVVLESVGTRYLSLYGSPYETTPCLAAEAGSSLVFDAFYAHTGYTYCELISIVFGGYPGLPARLRPAGARPLPSGLAELGRGRGARTGYFHSGDLDWSQSRYYIEAAGFEEVAGYEALGCAPLTSWGTEDRCLFDNLIAWIEREPGRPFQAMCWTDQTHDPYALSPGEPAIDFLRGARPPHADELGRYLNVVRTADAQLGRLFRALRERGLADDTLVVVTGDHGEAFGAPHRDVGHGGGLYEEEVRVPLVLWNPRLFSPGRRIATIGGHVDLAPTIAALLGLPPAAGWQGASLLDPDRPPRTYFLLGWDRLLLGVREERWKYFFSASDGYERLFDLAADADEQDDLSAREPGRCEEMRARIGAYLAAEGKYLEEAPR
jgi:hypothetical protein